MSGKKLIGMVMIIAGALALAYGGFSYTKETHNMDIGSLQMSVDEKEYVNVPIWAGIGGILVGGVLLAWRSKS